MHGIDLRSKLGRPALNGVAVVVVSGWLLVCALIAAAAAPLVFEAEAGTGNGEGRSRGNASGQQTIWLQNGEARRFSVVVDGTTTFATSVRYSNDNVDSGPFELVTVRIDGITVGAFTALDTSGPTDPGGSGWDVFRCASVGSRQLGPGAHELEISVAGGDGFGIEIDAVYLDPNAGPGCSAVEPTPTTTPTPSPTAPGTATPTTTPTRTPTPTPSPTTTPTNTPVPSLTSTATATRTLTPLLATGTPTPTPLPTAHPTAMPIPGVGFSITTLDGASVKLSWNPLVVAQHCVVLRFTAPELLVDSQCSLGGYIDTGLTPGALYCYILVLATNDAITGYTDPLCAVPGIGTIGNPAGSGAALRVGDIERLFRRP